MNTATAAAPADRWRTPVELTVLGAIWGGSFLFMRVAAADFGALPLVEARLEIGRELEKAQRELDAASARLVADGLAAWSGGEIGRALIVRGRANLLADADALADLERVRMLFDDLEQKEQLIGLLDLVRDAEGVRIFIGAETRLFSLSGSAVIAAPYMSGRQKVLGAIGVIGPARLNYARVIPLVDYTARALGRIMDG